MRIAIIGAGFSGSTLATFLATQADTAPEVCLVGVTETFGRGVAYGEARPEHLMNVRAKQLGADPNNPEDFAQWLNLGPQGRESFVPRLAYGEYLQDRLRNAKQSAQNLSFVRQEAVAINRIEKGFRVHLDDGSYFSSEQVVLALGALPPQRLAGVGPRLAQSKRYIPWPWLGDVLDRIDSQARVLVVGTGLTMADVVASLKKNRHAGEIVAISRHGLLPQTHLAQPSASIELPPSLQQSLRGHSVHQLFSAVRSLSRVVDDWRSAIDALRPHSQDFWRGLSTTERSRFLRHLRSYWEVVRHRVAPEIGQLLADLQSSGQLKVRAARLVRAGVRDTTAQVLIRNKGQEQLEVEQFDYVIRATGLDTDIINTTHPLISGLRDVGIVNADPNGLGLNVDDSLSVLDRHDSPIPGLYSIGPLLRGHLWEITAVPELRTAARQLADLLFAQNSSIEVPGKPQGNLHRELALSQSF